MKRPKIGDYESIHEYVKALEAYCDWTEKVGSIGVRPFKNYPKPTGPQHGLWEDK